MATFRPRLRPAVTTACSLVVVALMLVSTAACSKSKGNTVNANDAAGTVASIFSLPDDQRACLEQAFHDHSEATQPLATAGSAHDTDIEALGAAEAGCIHNDTLSEVLATGAAAGFGSLTTEQQACVPNTVGALSDGDRGLLLAGFTVPRESLSDAKSVAFGAIVNQLLDACGLSIDSTDTLPTGASGPVAGG